MKKVKFLPSMAIVLLVFLLAFFSCQKNERLIREADIDYLQPIQNTVKNGLDSLIDTLQKNYGVRVYYQFNPRIIDPTTFFTPTSKDQAQLYTKYVLQKSWMEPVKKHFPRFWANEKPIEFLIVGSYIKYNTISSGGAAGAGLNAQFYRLGMGGIDYMFFSNSNIRAKIREHMCILFHEHAHQMDNKYGRGSIYNRVSSADYYGLPGYFSKTEEQAQADGFFQAYGGYAPEEDFATTVESCLRFSKDSIMRIVAKNPKLKTKYEIVYNKYLDLGIDLHEMKLYLDSAVAAL